jgi:XTP/dITP diphosphohydrolase
LILATRNRHKLAEMAEMLPELELRPLPDELPSPAEDGDSFAANALIKARAAHAATGEAAIADDSGIEAEDLGGAPGIHSARYAGAGADDVANNRKLLAALAGLPAAARAARFICVVVYLRHAEDPVPLICEGVWRGRLLEAPRGANGFGYDPLFLVPELGVTSAELPSEQKNRLSHRGQALRRLVGRLADAAD